MPARTNEFQQLVHSIHRLLEPSAIVTESRLLKDRTTGESREVDIVIEAEKDGKVWLTSIECRDRGRRASVEWVEQMIGKHRDLPTDQLILISHNGFYDPALRKAEFHSVRALSLKEAGGTDWTQVVGKLDYVYVPFIASGPLQCEMHYALYYPVSDVPQVPLSASLYGSDDRELGTLEQIGWAIARNSEVGKSVMVRKDGIAGDYPVTVTYTVPNGSYVIDVANRRHEVKDLQYRILFKISERHAVPLQHATLGDLPVAFGPLTALGSDIRVTIIEPEGQPLSADLRGDLSPLDPKNWPNTR